jgi:hypothetical protein
MKTLRETLIGLMESESNTNSTGLTLSPAGWGVTFQKSDLVEGEVMILSKESLTEFARGGAWDDDMVYAACEWIENNLGEWTRSEEN